MRLLAGVLVVLFVGIACNQYFAGPWSAHEPGSNAAATSTISGYAHTTLVLNGASVDAEIADTEALRTLGLSGRAALVPGTGMLFVFEKEGVYRFWMKDMHFPIDIVWMNSHGVIVGIVRNLLPESYPKVFGPKVPARYVLELPAGDAAAKNLQLGDVIPLTR